MYEKVLITSTGEYLDEIIEHTLALVNGRKSEVIGLYVIETSAPFLTPQKVKEMMVYELKKIGKDVLSKMEKKLDKPNINFRKMMVEGDAADKIVKIAEEEKVDVIVIGTGKSQIDKRLLGSVSEKVVHSAPTTVHLIRTHSEK